MFYLDILFPRSINEYLIHRLVEGDVLENFDPGEKNYHGDDVVELFLPVTEKLEIRKRLWFLDQSWKEAF